MQISILPGSPVNNALLYYTFLLICLLSALDCSCVIIKCYCHCEKFIKINYISIKPLLINNINTCAVDFFKLAFNTNYLKALKKIKSI